MLEKNMDGKQTMEQKQMDVLASLQEKDSKLEIG